jgi:hypothetical protein
LPPRADARRKRQRLVTLNGAIFSRLIISRLGRDVGRWGGPFLSPSQTVVSIDTFIIAVLPQVGQRQRRANGSRAMAMAAAKAVTGRGISLDHAALEPRAMIGVP